MRTKDSKNDLVVQRARSVKRIAESGVMVKRVIGRASTICTNKIMRSNEKNC